MKYVTRIPITSAYRHQKERQGINSDEVKTRAYRHRAMADDRTPNCISIPTDLVATPAIRGDAQHVLVT